MTATAIAPRPRRVRTEEELKALAEEASARPADAPRRRSSPGPPPTFPVRLAVACSMAGDTVVAHLVAATVPGVDVLFLQTGYHFAETIGTRDALASVLDARVIDVLPEQSVAEQDAEHGHRLYERNPGAVLRAAQGGAHRRELAGLRGVGDRHASRGFPAARGHPGRGVGRRARPGQDQPLAAWSFDELLTTPVPTRCRSTCC